LLPFSWFFQFFFLMFAVFRLLPPQGGESVTPYQAFGAHPLMQITEAIHITHCSKSLYTNITPFFPTLQADPSDSANDTKNAPGFLSWKPGALRFYGKRLRRLQSLSAAGS
jgi:ethanolamine transporter EutH